MRKTTIAVLAAALSMTASAAGAGTLVNPTITLSNNGPSQPTAIIATHTTATTVPADNYIMRFELPADFSTSLIANQFGNCTGITLKIDGVPQTFSAFDPCGKVMSGLVYVRTPKLVSAGAAVEVEVASSFYTTPATPGVKTFQRFETADGGGSEIDRASPMPTVTIIAPAPVPTMTEWAMLLLTAALGGFAALTIQRRHRTV